MSDKSKIDQKKILIRAWKARVFLRCNGFLSESENTKIRKRLVAFQSKHDIKVTEKEIFE